MTDTFPAAAVRASVQDSCDYWNAKFPAGTEVHAVIAGRSVLTHTASPAMAIGRYAAVAVRGHDRALPLTEVTPVTDWEVQR